MLAVALPAMCSEWTTPEKLLVRCSETSHARYAHITGQVQITNANQPLPLYPLLLEPVP